MSSRMVQLVFAAVLLAISPGLALAGKISVANNGAPLGEATVSVETFGGEQLATTRTNPGGVADCETPQTAAGQPLVFKVTDKAGTVTEHYLAQPADKPWHVVAMDTRGGIVGYSKETYDHLKTAMEPIYVGKNSEVGSGAKLKQAVKQKVGGGAFGGGKSSFSLGGGGGSMGGINPMQLGKADRGDRDVEIFDDPVADADKRIFTHPDTGLKIALGAQFQPGGLLVSSGIIEAPGQGTYQSMSLMDENGNMAGPSRIMIYQTYEDWWLQVHWWRETYVDGQLVSREEGGWSDEGRILGDTYSQPIGSDGLWNRAGFASALGGVQDLGAVFPTNKSNWEDFKLPLDLSHLDAVDLAKPTMTLVGHVTRPKEDPVTTIGFGYGLASPSVEKWLHLVDISHRLEDVKNLIDEKQEQIAQLRKGLSSDQQDQERIKQLESEIKDLEDEQGRLEAEQAGTFSPVVDMLQPVVILS